MPIIEARPKRAFDRFEKHMHELVHAVLPIPHGVKLALRRSKNAAALEFVRGSVATAVPVETRVGMLYLAIAQDLLAVREISGFRLRTTRYQYKLLPNETATAEAVLRWEYDSTIEDDGVCRHHVHAKVALPLGEGLSLDRVHTPTGWVLIENILRFLFTDLGVAPVTESWPDLLRVSETKFHDSFTSKGWKGKL
jgi:hypothetical protein